MIHDAQPQPPDWWRLRAQARRARNRWAWRGWSLIDWTAVDEWCARRRRPIPDPFKETPA